MAVPKRKMSRANTRTRRSTWKADLTELNTVKVAGREIRVLTSHPRTGPGLVVPGLCHARNSTRRARESRGTAPSILSPR